MSCRNESIDPHGFRRVPYAFGIDDLDYRGPTGREHVAQPLLRHGQSTSGACVFLDLIDVLLKPFSSSLNFG
jgi:hypothetical protein